MYTSAPDYVFGDYHAGMGKVLARVPSAVFAPSVPGAPRYTVADRAACLGVKFLEYSLAGMACGFVGQGVANGLMQIKCAVGKGLCRMRRTAATGNLRCVTPCCAESSVQSICYRFQHPGLVLTPWWCVVAPHVRISIFSVLSPVAGGFGG